MYRIAVGGFQHETNTFLPQPTDYALFAAADGWPALTEGDALAEVFSGANIPIAGALDVLQRRARTVPLLWCSAPPGGRVTTDAFERIVSRLLQGIERAMPLDGIYLDLHGAMVTAEREDGEGELLQRIRRMVGPRIPIVASLDLHANVSDAMLAASDALVAYRTYPHLDMAESGGRAVKLLLAMLQQGERPEKALRKLPFLIPLTAQSTLMEPNRSLYAELDRQTESTVFSESFCCGFPPADIHDCGPALLVYAAERKIAEAHIEALERQVRDASARYESKPYGEDEAIRYAMARTTGRPVIIADTQDNPGAGAHGDTTGMLAALIRHGARDATLAILVDAEAAARAHELGIGADATFTLGGHSGAAGSTAYRNHFTVEALGDGNFACTGPMYGGSRMQLGPMALLRHDGVRVVIGSVRQQAGDQAILRHLGVAPERERIIVLKSSVHFRADFMRLSDDIIVVASPGPNIENPEDLPYRHLRDGIALRPGGRLYHRNTGSRHE